MKILTKNGVTGILLAAFFSVASSAVLAGKGIQGSGTVLASGENAQSQSMEKSKYQYQHQYQHQKGKGAGKGDQSGAQDQAKTQDQAREKVQFTTQDER